MSEQVSILVADDDKEVRSLFSNILGSLDYDVTTAKDGKEAVEFLKHSHFDIAILDYRMPKMDGIEVLERSRKMNPSVNVIIMTGYGNTDLAVKAMKMGAEDFITKPFEVNDVQKIISRLVRTQISLPRPDRKDKYTFCDMIGTTTRMQEVFEIIRKLSRNRTTVLIQGESGTGKELIAKAIHECGPSAGGPFIPVDCGSINENLIESELFGHEKGSFTGAYSSKKGLFRVAHGGVIFLDEISEIPRDVQAKLLRCLQERKVKPVGGTEYIDVNVRVIAATNQNLSEAIKDGQFREDLFYRLNVVPIDVPPLRERKSDIPHLANHFVELYSRESRPVHRTSQKAMKLLLRYDWPGNVRELENVVQRAIALGELDIIDVCDLPSHLVNDTAPPQVKEADEDMQTLEEIEREAILRTLEKTGGDKAKAAQVLQIDKSTLYRKLKKYGTPD